MRHGVRIAGAGGGVRLAVLVLVAGLMAVPAESVAQEPPWRYWFGQRVVPKRRDIKILNRQDFPARDRLITSHFVMDVKGDSLQIATSRGQVWVPADQVVLINMAVKFFSDAIRANPRDPFNYLMRAEGFLEESNEPDKALTDLKQAIHLDPKDALAYQLRAEVWSAKRDWDKAIADCDESIRLDPKNASSYARRGQIWCGMKAYDKALADFDQAIRVDPKNDDAYCWRGYVWSKKREYAKALVEYDKAMQIDPQSKEVHFGRAWIWATAIDANYRDGHKAVAAATRACELTGWKKAPVLDAMAAASAEVGDFEAAVKWETRAIQLETVQEVKNDYAARLALYREKKPYHDVKP